MRRIIVRNLIFFVLVLTICIPVWAVSENVNVLDNISFKKISDNTIEVQLQTKKKLPSPPLLFEKGRNVYFISLPATSYDGERRIDITHFSKELMGVTIDFVPYKTAKETGYTRIVIETSDNTKLKLNNVVSIGGAALLILVLKLLGVIFAIGCFGVVAYVLYRKFLERKNLKNILDFDDVYIENADDSVNSSDENEVLSYIDDISNEDIIDHVKDISDQTTELKSAEIIDEDMSHDKFDNQDEIANLVQDENDSKEENKADNVINFADENLNNSLSELTNETAESSLVEDKFDNNDINSSSVPFSEFNEETFETQGTSSVDNISSQVAPDGISDLRNMSFYEDKSEIESNFYPSPDEIVSDILNNDEAITELSDTIMNTNSIDGIVNTNEESIAGENFDESNSLPCKYSDDIETAEIDKIDNIPNNVQEKDFKSVDIPKNSAGAVFTPKTLDLTPKMQNVQESAADNLQSTEQIEKNDDLSEQFIFTERDDSENPNSYEDMTEDELVELFPEETNVQPIEYSPYNIDGLDAVIADVPTADEVADNFHLNSDGNDEVITDAISQNVVFENTDEGDLHSDNIVDIYATENDINEIVKSLEDDHSDLQANNNTSGTPEDLSADIEHTDTDMETSATSQSMNEDEQNNIVNSALDAPEQELFEAESPYKQDLKSEVSFNTDNFFSNSSDGSFDDTEKFYKNEEDEIELEELTFNDFFKEPDKEEKPEHTVVNEDTEPIVISQEEVSEGKYLYLIKHQGAFSLIGLIGEDVFVLNKFETPPVKENIVVKLNETRDGQEIYIVKVGAWRALISIDENLMENILTLS